MKYAPELLFAVSKIPQRAKIILGNAQIETARPLIKRAMETRNFRTESRASKIWQRVMGFDAQTNRLITPDDGDQLLQIEINDALNYVY